MGDGILLLSLKEKEAFSQQFPGLFQLFGDWAIVLVIRKVEFRDLLRCPLLF